jgi:hypothetical protein
MPCEASLSRTTKGGAGLSTSKNERKLPVACSQPSKTDLTGGRERSRPEDHISGKRRMTMQNYYVQIEGEDRTEFTIEVEALDAGDAMQKAEDMYPEAHIVDAWIESERQQAVYDRLQARYDRDEYDLY